MIEIPGAALRENDSVRFAHQVIIPGAELSAPKDDLNRGSEARVKGEDLHLFDFTHTGHYS